MGRQLKCHGLQVLVNLSSSLEMSDSISDLSYSKKCMYIYIYIYIYSVTYVTHFSSCPTRCF